MGLISNWWKKITGTAVAPVAEQRLAPSLDLEDPAIGNPRDRMSQLSVAQLSALSNASIGNQIAIAPPGKADEFDDDECFLVQARTVKSLVKAEFLVESAPNRFRITPLGIKALHTLSTRSN